LEDGATHDGYEYMEEKKKTKKGMRRSGRKSITVIQELMSGTYR
jgi:hypothetical protein